MSENPLAHEFLAGLAIGAWGCIIMESVLLLLRQIGATVRIRHFVPLMLVALLFCVNYLLHVLALEN